MPSSASITKIDFDKLIDGKIEDFTVAVAENALKSAVGAGKFGTDVSVITDGVANRDYHQVKPYGKIEFVQSGSLQEVARWILSELARKSPVLTGRYQKSHIFMINGLQADDDALDRLKPGDLLQVVNTQPYAGKIEGRDAFTRWDAKKGTTWHKHGGKGLTRWGVRKKQGQSRSAGQGESAQARNGVYRVVLAEAQARYGRLVVIKYAPTQLSLGVKVWGQQGGRRSAFGNPRKRVMRPQIYPCFTIQSKSLY
jgi:hypothetical protein